MFLEAAAAIGKEALYFSIIYLLKALVPFADGAKEFRSCQTDQIVDSAAKAAAGFGGPHWDANDYLCRLQTANVPNRCAHGTSGSQAVVDQNGRFAMKIERRTACAVERFAAMHLGQFACDRAIDVLIANAEFLNHAFVENARLARDRTHGEFGLPGDANFTGNNDVERKMQSISDGESNGDTSARQSEDDGIGREVSAAEFGGEKAACFGAIGKWKVYHDRAPSHNSEQPGSQSRSGHSFSDIGTVRSLLVMVQFGVFW